ncbi:MAG: hypothetical protein ACTSX9_08945 [Candidatus Njordarchaeales archaeon]
MVEEIFAVRERPEDIFKRRLKIFALILVALVFSVVIHNLLVEYLLLEITRHSPAVINNWFIYSSLLSIIGFLHGTLTWLTGFTLTHVFTIVRYRQKKLEIAALVLTIWGLLLIITYLPLIFNPLTLQDFLSVIESPPSLVEYLIYALPVLGYFLLGLSLSRAAKHLSLGTYLRIGGYLTMVGAILFLVRYGWIVLSGGLLIISVGLLRWRRVEETMNMISSEETTS